MAANSSATKGIAILGKRVVFEQICAARSAVRPHLPVAAAASSSRKNVHTSTYDKNEDYEQVRPAVVPDNVIGQNQPDKYWAPNPQTGVFGPANDQTTQAGGERGFSTASTESVLEQKAFFRSIEDIEKPQHP